MWFKTGGSKGAKLSLQVRERAFILHNKEPHTRVSGNAMKALRGNESLEIGYGVSPSQKKPQSNLQRRGVRRI